jgi:hypothetical protein
MLHLARVLFASAALAGCTFELSQPQPKMVWLRLDGQRGAGNPVLTQQFETDRAACLGTTQQGIDPSQAVDAVAKDCMAAKGYIQVPEDQAAAKLQELAAANTQRHSPAVPSRKIPGP